MKLLLLLLTSLSFSAAVPGQKADSNNFKRARWGLVFSPDYCYRFLNYSAPYKPVEDLRNSIEQPTFGFTSGLAISIYLTPKISMETGLCFSVTGVETREAELLWATPGTQYPTRSKTKFHYNYLDIPVVANYFVTTGRIKFFISCGASLNIFTEKKTILSVEYADGDQGSGSSSVDLGFLKFNLAAIVGLGVKYEISNSIFMVAEPVYRQFINSIVADKNAKEYPYSIGMNIKIFYALKKYK